MSNKLDAAIGAPVDALAELPEHEREWWQCGNRLGLRIYCSALPRHHAADGPGSPQVGLSALPTPRAALPLLAKLERLLLAVDNPTPASPFTAQFLSSGPSGLLRSPSHCLGEYCGWQKRQLI
jgi:hypothetical protein